MKKTALLNRPRGAPSSLSQHNLDIADAPTPLRGGSLELGPEEDVYDARRVRDHHIDGHGKLILRRVVAWMGTGGGIPWAGTGAPPHPCCCMHKGKALLSGTEGSLGQVVRGGGIRLAAWAAVRRSVSTVRPCRRG